MRGEELGSEIKKGARKNQLRNPAKSPEWWWVKSCKSKKSIDQRLWCLAPQQNSTDRERSPKDARKNLVGSHRSVCKSSMPPASVRKSAEDILLFAKTRQQQKVNNSKHVA
jgi:hypothetical protein